MHTTQIITNITLIAVLCVACAEPQEQKTDYGARVEPEQSQTRKLAQIRQTKEEDATGKFGYTSMPKPEAKPASRNTTVANVSAALKSRAQPSAKYFTADVAGEFVSVQSAHPEMQAYAIDTENYLNYPSNGVKNVTEEPVSTFSVDVDTAAYANVRRMLSQEGRLPPSDAVRLEEMINYFNYSYTPPVDRAQPFSIHTEMAPAPWSENHQLLQIGLKGFEPKLEQRPAANLVFLVDVSGSMQSANKLGLVKKSLRLLVNRMTAGDKIALAVYAGAAGVVLESTPGSQKAKILAAIEGLTAGGSTHGSAGIKLAYNLAEQNHIEGGINRVIIASDGDMNVGTVNIEALKDLISYKRDKGIALTTLGFGSGNYNYALMEQLADVGNGNASYIDSLQEAHKVLVNEMQSTLLTIASDVKIQVEFNPAVVSEYRLIGYENRMLNREDFNNDKVDAGDIGAGHTVTALYEIVLNGSDGKRIPNLRYGSQHEQEKMQYGNGELAFVKLRYKQPGEATSKLVSQAISTNSLNTSIEQGSDNLRFAASVAGFGQILQGGTFTGNWSYNDALTLARNSRGQDPHGYRSEFVHLIELAQSLSSGS
ncbi:MAG: Ca-activated chloride channel family protein [Halioglobus sp.]|jgi:Ca-activated chloride channel family protein